MRLSFKRLGLAALLATSMIPASCTVLVPQTENVRAPDGLSSKKMYRSTRVSGSVVTADGSIGVFAIASVSITRRGYLALTFFRLTDSRDPLIVRKVRFHNTETMTTGREVRFNDGGVSIAVRGRFDYSAYFRSIPIQVEFSAGEHTWSRELELRFSYADTYMDGIGVEPKAPKTVAAFLALQRSPASSPPAFPTTERP